MLEKFLESKDIKEFYGDYELGISINNYQSGCYIELDSINGYNIHLNDNYMMLTINNNTKEFKFKSKKNILDILKNNLKNK